MNRTDGYRGNEMSQGSTAGSYIASSIAIVISVCTLIHNYLHSKKTRQIAEDSLKLSKENAEYQKGKDLKETEEENIRKGMYILKRALKETEGYLWNQYTAKNFRDQTRRINWQSPGAERVSFFKPEDAKAMILKMLKDHVDTIQDEVPSFDVSILWELIQNIADDSTMVVTLKEDLKRKVELYESTHEELPVNYKIPFNLQKQIG